MMKNDGSTITTINKKPLPLEEAQKFCYENSPRILTELYLVEADENGNEIIVENKLSIIEI